MNAVDMYVARTHAHVRSIQDAASLCSHVGCEVEDLCQTDNHVLCAQALVPLKRAVDEVVIPAVAKAEIRDRIAALTRRYLDAQKVGRGVWGSV